MDDMIFSFKVETPPAWIPIGRTAENDWRTIEIDCSYWFNMDASGNVVLMYRPNCGMAPYPLLIERDGDNIVWHPKSGELVEGVGQMQAFFYVGESKIGSSEMVSCEVDGSLLGGDTGTDPGAVAPPWAIDIIEQIAVLSGHYPKIIDGDLFVWDSEIEDWVQFEGGSSDAVLYTEQALTDAQKAQARENIGAGTYSKPSGGIPDSDIASAATWNAKYTKPASGIPASDLAAGVIPTVPQMATDPDMSDWTSGKTVDASAMKKVVSTASTFILENSDEISNLQTDKADKTDIPTAVSELANDSGYQTAQDVQTAIAAKYTKPSGGIPASDLASDVQTSLGKADTALQSAPVTSVNNKTGAVTLGASDVHALPDSTVIPSVPQMATATNMSDWTSGKTVDAAALKTGFQFALQQLYGKASQDQVDAIGLHVDSLDLDVQALQDAGYQTASDVQTAIADKADKSELPDASTSTPVMDGTAAVGTSTDYARADHVHPSDTTRLSTTGNAYRSASIPMGHLDSTSTATVMTATVDGITELRDGVCMWLRNGVITSASGFTLNVNGLGAKPCYSSLAAASRSTTIFNVNYTMLMVYNEDRVEGGCWDIVYGVDTNTTYTPVKLGFGYGTCTTAAATAAKTASISSYALTTGGIVSIHFSNDVPANATLNISSKGSKAIYYRGAAITAGVIKAGDTATFIYSTYYHLIAIDRDESGDVLPSVTASDNGKFLRVVNGAWAAAMIPAAESNSF